MEKGKSTLYQAISVLQKAPVPCRKFTSQNSNIFCNSDMKLLFHPLVLMDKFRSVPTESIATFTIACIALNKS